MNSSFWVSSSLALRESTSVSRRSTKTPSLLLLGLLLALLVLVDDSLSLSFLLLIFLIDVSWGSDFSSGIRLASFSSLSSSSSSSSLSSELSSSSSCSLLDEGVVVWKMYSSISRNLYPSND